MSTLVSFAMPLDTSGRRRSQIFRRCNFSPCAPYTPRPMDRRARITLTQLFALATAGVVVLVGVLLYASVRGSREAILASADHLRASSAERIATRVRSELGQADRALVTVEHALASG